MSHEQLLKSADEAIENGLILYPELPPAVLADRLIEEADESFVSEYGRSLIVAAFVRMIRARRVKHFDRPDGYEHLPIWIRLPDGRRIRLDRATSWNLTVFARARRAKRAGDDPVAIEAEEMAEQLRRAGKKRKTKGLTAGQVLGFEW